MPKTDWKSREDETGETGEFLGKNHEIDKRHNTTILKNPQVWLKANSHVMKSKGGN